MNPHSRLRSRESRHSADTDADAAAKKPASFKLTAEIKEVLCRQMQATVIPLEAQQKKLHELINRTLESGKSNSIMLLGGHNTGKSTVHTPYQALEAVLASFERNGKPPFLTVHLNGIVHTDDRLALKATIRQLGLGMQIEGAAVTSFADSLSFILNTLRSGTLDTMPIVFVLKELDLFAQHSKQLLLYNLFDICQSNQTPIVVVGLTSRLDTVDLFEKRVKSRFSHRSIYFYPLNDIKTVLDIVRTTLVLSNNHSLSKVQLDSWHECIDVSITNQELLDDSSVKNIIQKLLDFNSDVSLIFRVFVHSTKKTLAIHLSNHLLLPTDVLRAYADITSCQRIHQVKGFSVLQLLLLISIKELMKASIVQMNFEMIFNEYRTFAKRQSHLGRGGVNFHKPVAIKAFETLERIGLLASVSGQGAQCPREYRMMLSKMSCDQITLAVEAYEEQCPDSIIKWFAKLT